MPSDALLPPGSTIGIVGGGQLGRMLALAAARLGMKVHVYCPDPQSPAFDVAATHTCAAYDDVAALAAFAAAVDVVTYEFENVPAATAEFLAARVPLRPGANALAISQDRIAEKTFLEKSGIAVAPWRPIHTASDLEAALQARGIGVQRLTLHVGAGTFLPVKADDTADHKMHAEWGSVSAETARTLNEARAKGRRIVAVGSTAMRLLESAATEDGIIQPFTGETAIFITPGYRFRAVDVMMTNFHLPRSTLFMLVSAFSGLETMQAAYAHAIAKGYRFYSYGDACLLFADTSRAA